jgi:class 3 adenylate cyclase
VDGPETDATRQSNGNQVASEPSLRTADRRRLVTVLIVALIGGLIGLGYGFVLSRADPFSWNFSEMRVAALSGFFVAGLTSTFELLWYQGPHGRWLRRRMFLVSFLVRVLILTALIFLALMISRVIHIALEGVDLQDGLPAYSVWRDVAFSFVVLVGFIFVLQTVSLVGGRTLRDFLLGRYYRPVEEQRIFLFLDMKGSSKQAQRLGNARFHTFLSDAFFVIDGAIVDNGGEVVSYVGDMVIATWPLASPAGNVRALIAAREAFARLEAERDRYNRSFGAVPEFRAVINGGSVVIGETGDSRRQITYLGDVLNVTARLEEVAKTRGIDLAIAGPLFDQIDLPAGFSAVPLGALRLRGVAEPVNVFEVLMA